MSHTTMSSAVRAPPELLSLLWLRGVQAPEWLLAAPAVTSRVLMEQVKVSHTCGHMQIEGAGLICAIGIVSIIRCCCCCCMTITFILSGVIRCDRDATLSRTSLSVLPHFNQCIRESGVSNERLQFFPTGEECSS